VLPPAGPLLVAAVGLMLYRRKPVLARALTTLGVCTLLLLSLPAVGSFLLLLVDKSPPLDLGSAKTAQAIVILGGGVRRNAAEYGGDTLGRLTLERVRYGARVARLTGLPVLVTGGIVLGGDPEAEIMREVLENEYGIRPQWVEARSRTTHENAVFSAALLRNAGVERVLLVAHGFDMPRATAEFSQESIATIRAPTGIVNLNYTPLDFLPSVAGLQDSYYALYEMLANAVLRVRTAF